jgi:hypothetical protein
MGEEFVSPVIERRAHTFVWQDLAICTQYFPFFSSCLEQKMQYASTLTEILSCFTVWTILW